MRYIHTDRLSWASQKAHEFSEEAPCQSALVLISCLLHIKSGTFPSKYNYTRAPPQRFWFNWCGWGLGHLLMAPSDSDGRVRNNSREEPRIGRDGPRGEVQLESLSQLCKQQQQSRLWRQNGNQIPCLSLASWAILEIGFNSPNLSFLFCKMRLILSVQDSC